MSSGLMPSSTALIIDFAHSTALSAAMSMPSAPSKYAITASPTNFSTYPLYCRTTYDISWTNELMMDATLSSDISRVIAVEPTRSVYITAMSTFSRTWLRRNASDSSNGASYV